MTHNCFNFVTLSGECVCVVLGCNWEHDQFVEMWPWPFYDYFNLPFRSNVENFCGKFDSFPMTNRKQLHGNTRGSSGESESEDSNEFEWKLRTTKLSWKNTGLRTQLLHDSGDKYSRQLSKRYCRPILPMRCVLGKNTRHIGFRCFSL